MNPPVSATKLVHHEIHQGVRFTVLQGENHQFYAIRDRSPYFCFEGDTPKEAMTTAYQAIELHNFTQGWSNGL